MAKVEQTSNVNLVSRISSGTFIKGEIVSPNDLRIDGKFEGSICSEGKVVIGETAEVNADVVCVNADIWGKAKGTFTVREVLSIKSGCAVEGDLRIKKLAVELDSSFNGTCRMISDQDYENVAKNFLKKENVKEDKQQKTNG